MARRVLVATQRPCRQVRSRRGIQALAPKLSPCAWGAASVRSNLTLDLATTAQPAHRRPEPTYIFLSEHMGRMSAIQPESKASTILAAATNVVVGSTNPVKIAAVTAVLELIGSHARVRGLAVPSGVRDQPEGDAKTIRGATQRATAALEASGADLAVGIEGGIVEEAGYMRTCA